MIHYLKLTPGTPEITPGVSRVGVAPSLIICVVFCPSLFVPFLLTILFLLFYCLSFFHSRILLTNLISSSFSQFSALCFVDRCLFFCPFLSTFVCPSIYDSWCLQTLFPIINTFQCRILPHYIKLVKHVCTNTPRQGGNEVSNALIFLSR